MFDSLADRFDGIFAKLRSKGKLTEKEIDEVCRELRVALLEADVNVVVARNFIKRVKERALGAEVAKSLTPAQQVIKIVNEELVATLGGTTGKLTVAPKPPSRIMMAGLQGSGKTTASAKLARLLKSQGRRPLLVGADLSVPPRWSSYGCSVSGSTCRCTRRRAIRSRSPATRSRRPPASGATW
jgi:signal recognition particle subunit SRP54